MKRYQSQIFIENLKKDLNKDLNLDIREFLKKYTKDLNGPTKIPFLVFFILGNKKTENISRTEIKKTWEKNKGILGKFYFIYITRAREYGFLKKDLKKKGYYILPPLWLEKVIKREPEKFKEIKEEGEKEKRKKYPEIFPSTLLNKIKKTDKKIYTLGVETNKNWQLECWNACGILMRIILERALDRKDIRIRQKMGLKDKINFSFTTSVFNKSIKEALKKLDLSTKITGDIVAHDSNILLSKNDIELAIVPLNILLKDVFKL